MSLSTLDKGKRRALPEDEEPIPAEENASSSDSTSDSDSDSETDSEVSETSSESDEEDEITQDVLDSLLEKARQSASKSSSGASGVAFNGEEDVIQLEKDEKETYVSHYYRATHIFLI